VSEPVVNLILKDEEMAEPTPMELMQLESIGNIQSANTRARDAAILANNVLQGAMSRNFDELGPVEGRTVSGVNATPLAPPAAGS
jgi:hypothetical protein